jgi:hypothetical protein
VADPFFSEAAVLEAARRATGLSDFGDPGFREGLRVLLETYEKTADFNDEGRAAARERVVQLLSTRLRIQAALARHPEIRERRISQPLYLTGLPRTGTSALFNLLAEDPAARPLLGWEGWAPYPIEELPPPPPERRPEAPAPHRGAWLDPEFEKIHHASPNTPEECVLLLSHDFCDVQLGIEVLMEPYASWFQAQDLQRPYAYYRDLLQMLDWQRPGKRWLLKSPAHLWALDVLVELLPDACIVLTHRDPLECIPSYCSMMAFLMRDRRRLDKRELGPTVLEYVARSLERGLAARTRCDPARFLDVDYRSFVADPLRTVERIYRHFGLELTGEAERAMRRHASENPKGRRGAHEYGLEEYGLTPEAVTRRFSEYLVRYGLRAP